MDEDVGRTLYTCPRHYMRKAEDIDWAAELAIFARRPRAPRIRDVSESVAEAD